MAVSNRTFLIAATRYLAQQGVTQCLDIGSGLPTQRCCALSTSPGRWR
ncbi:SAM-dependent methyltransferase [Nonomuraea rosea]